MFDFIYKKLYILGLYTARYFNRFLRGFSRVALRPIKALGTLLFAGLVMLKGFFSKYMGKGLDEVKDLMADVKGVNKSVKETFNKGAGNGFGLLLKYVKTAFSRHGIVLRILTEFVAPAMSLVVLILTINYWSGKNLALKITYNNAEIGYVKNESVYLEAEKKASQRLATAAVTGEGNAQIKAAQYTIEPAKITDLNDSDVMCDKIIERSSNNITNACGIYIDGAFLCAVKNETDAETVFDNMLVKYGKNEEDSQDSQENDESKSGATVSFAEQIEYIQGLYPDDENTILDADKLSRKLSNNKKEAVYYAAQNGDTLAGVAGQYNVSINELKRLNPDLSSKLDDGDKVMISEEQDLVRVQLTKTETRRVEVKYQTVEIETSSLYKGIKKTVTDGQNGVQEITELVTYIDGERVNVKEVSRKTLIEPVDKRVQVGTKTNPYGTATSYGGRFIWPSMGAYSISSYFGYRSMGWHGGIDIIRSGGFSTGIPIVAAGDGVVASASYHYSWGYNVVINHGNGLSTRYAHMQPGSFKVSAGQRVYAGQPIGNIGSTGNVTGPHLHFEVMVNGNRVNPMPYLK